MAMKKPGKLEGIFLVLCVHPDVNDGCRSLSVVASDRPSTGVCSVAARATRGLQSPSATGPQGNARQRAERYNPADVLYSQHSQLHRSHPTAVE